MHVQGQPHINSWPSLELIQLFRVTWNCFEMAGPLCFCTAQSLEEDYQKEWVFGGRLQQHLEVLGPQDFHRSRTWAVQPYVYQEVQSRDFFLVIEG